MTSRFVGGLLSFGVALVGVPPAAAADPPAPPRVPVSLPVQRQVTDYESFTGRTEAVESVEVRARVTGYVARTPFEEGSPVKRGDVLFEIDPRPYQARLDEQEAQVALARAQLRLHRATLARDQALARATPGSISQEQLDQDRTAVEEAVVRVKVREATREVARLNLQFTRVTSPIDGQVGRAFLTAGNLVRQDETRLTIVVSLEPMYVYFHIDPGTLLRIRKAINEGKIKPPGNGQAPVAVGLPGEDGYPHQGVVNFVNNRFERNTDTIVVRAVLPNPQPPGGVRLLAPGMMGVRVRLPVGPPYAAILVSDGVITSDGGAPYVYVVDADSKVQRRRVKLGALQSDGLRVVEGLKPGERVVVAGLRRLRPGMTVDPEVTAMPTPGRPAAEPLAPAAPSR